MTANRIKRIIVEFEAKLNDTADIDVVSDIRVSLINRINALHLNSTESRAVSSLLCKIEEKRGELEQSLMEAER